MQTFPATPTIVLIIKNSNTSLQVCIIVSLLSSVSLIFNVLISSLSMLIALGINVGVGRHLFVVNTDFVENAKRCNNDRFCIRSYNYVID